MSSLAEVTLSTPHSFLAELAPMAAGGWHALGAQIYPGELSVATDDGVYRFVNGVFLGRAQKAARTFERPKAMHGLRLVGFLFDEGGMWSLSPRWQAGAHAVLWRDGEIDAQSFVLTSPTNDFTIEEPDPKPHEPGPKPTPWATARPSSPSGIKLRRPARPPSIRRPLPASMTRIHLSH
ncbi:MAG: hypothetical protein JWO86_2282 [Myxococcaceae bacterium]|jgi:hypothetical protein|nr:hypothetical protein [Myxococcaceae bacterium]MEA2747371.1 hypothetical protein [Myxococcales bacterium]